jgi:hypothetical protein
VSSSNPFDLVCSTYVSVRHHASSYVIIRHHTSIDKFPLSQPQGWREETCLVGTLNVWVPINKPTNQVAPSRSPFVFYLPSESHPTNSKGVTSKRVRLLTLSRFELFSVTSVTCQISLSSGSPTSSSFSWLILGKVTVIWISWTRLSSSSSRGNTQWHTSLLYYLLRMTDIFSPKFLFIMTR